MFQYFTGFTRKPISAFLILYIHKKKDLKNMKVKQDCVQKKDGMEVMGRNMEKNMKIKNREKGNRWKH